MDRIYLNVHLLLDDRSRANLKVNIADLTLHDVNILNSLKELTDSTLAKTNKVVILEEYLRKSNSFSDLVLYKELFNLEYIYIGTDDTLLRVMTDLASCYKMDYTMLDYDRVYSIVYSDEALQRKFIVSSKINPELEEFANTVIGNPDYDEKIRLMAESFISMSQVVSDNERELDSSREAIEDLMTKVQSYSDDNDALIESYFSLISNAKDLNRTLKQYEAILSKDVYDKIILSKYVNRPTIIYLKEHEELLYMNSLLNTLADTFKYQFKKSVKVLRLYDSSRSRRILTIPNYYKVIQNKFERRSVISSDFVVKVGNYREVLDLLLTNHSRLDVLIIVDCKDHGDTVITGSYVHLSMCRNVKNLNAYGLDIMRTIVNNDKGNPMSWDYYADYEKMDNNEKFLFLSSRPVIQNIYELSKVFSQIGG